MTQPLTSADCFEIANRADSMMDHNPFEASTFHEYEAKLKALRDAAWKLRHHLCLAKQSV